MWQFCEIYSWKFVSIYAYLSTSQCLAENRIVCGYSLIRLKLLEKQDVGFRARNVSKKCRELSLEWSSIMILAEMHTLLILGPLIQLQLLSMYQVKSSVLHLQSHYNRQRWKDMMQWPAITSSCKQVQVRKQPTTYKLYALKSLIDLNI